jgi:predicted dehydrogenase
LSSDESKHQTSQADQYAVSGSQDTAAIEAPALAYQPVDPKTYRPRIALIGCGGITEWHLHAYQRAGYEVVALCDRYEDRARQRARQYYPSAAVYTDAASVLQRDDIDVVDIATHPEHRGRLIEAAIEAGKHILTQKPFVLDLEAGRELVHKARQANVKLAVNQNGRWAPHWSYLRQALREELVGPLQAVDFSVYWDHNWVAGTPFDAIRHLLLYDFAIHWFDILCCFANGAQPQRVLAMLKHGPAQKAKPPLLGQVLVEYADFQASIVLRANTRQGPSDRTRLIGSKATFESAGPDLNHQQLSIAHASGEATFTPEGAWFPDGFHGAMAELLCAIEEDRPPSNAAEHNLASLQLCFAAATSADEARVIEPTSINAMPGG